jgi:hypothetical protein
MHYLTLQFANFFTKFTTHIIPLLACKELLIRTTDERLELPKFSHNWPRKPTVLVALHNKGNKETAFGGNAGKPRR